MGYETVCSRSTKLWSLTALERPKWSKPTPQLSQHRSIFVTDNLSTFGFNAVLHHFTKLWLHREASAGGQRSAVSSKNESVGRFCRIGIIRTHNACSTIAIRFDRKMTVSNTISRDCGYTGCFHSPLALGFKTCPRNTSLISAFIGLSWKNHIRMGLATGSRLKQGQSAKPAPTITKSNGCIYHDSTNSRFCRSRHSPASPCQPQING